MPNLSTRARLQAIQAKIAARLTTAGASWSKLELGELKALGAEFAAALREMAPLQPVPPPTPAAIAAAFLTEYEALLAKADKSISAGERKGINAAVAARVAMVPAEAPPTAPPPPPTSPPPPPVPPPPPPPQSGEWTALPWLLRVPVAGRVALGVPLETPFDVRSVRVGGVLAQADNSTGRWFMLSAILPAGDHPIEVSAAPDARAPLPMPAVATQVTGRTGWLPKQDHRCGAVVRETIYDVPNCRLHEAVWADDARSATVRPRHSGVAPGAVISALTYDVKITRGAEVLSYTGVQHNPHTEYLRRLGDQPVFAELRTLDGGDTWEVFKRAGRINKYTWSKSEHAPLSLAPLSATPTTPFAITSPGDGSQWGGNIGYFSRAQGSPGGNPDIGDHPYYYLNALRNFSPDGLYLIGWHADARLGGAYFFQRPEGGHYRMDDGTDYGLGHFLTSGPYVANQYWNPSHWGAHFAIPYWVTGRLEYLEGQIAQQFVSWCNTYPDDWAQSGQGNQLTRHPLVAGWLDPAAKGIPHGFPQADRGSGRFLQWRTMGWSVRTTVHLLASLPPDDERMRALTGWDRTMVDTLWTNVQAWAKRVWIDTHTGPGKRFAEDGLHPAVPNVGAYKTWMHGMEISSLSVGLDLGVLNADGEAFYRWNVQTPIAVVNSPDVIPDFLLQGNLATVTFDGSEGYGGYNYTNDPNDWRAGTAPARTLADAYRGTAQSAGAGDGGWSVRLVDNPTGIVCEPAVAAWNEEVAFRLTPGPSGDCFPRPTLWAWYKDMPLFVRGDNMTDPAGFIENSTALVITEITGPNAGRARVGMYAKGTMGALSGPLGSVVLGWPHPGDGRARGMYPPMGEGDYIGWFTHLVAQAVEHGVPGAAEALAWLRAYHQRHNLPLNATHQIAPRAAA